MRITKLGLTEGTFFEATQQWVLTEVEEAGENQQQQVGGSQVHPERMWFTAVRLKYSCTGPTRQGQQRAVGRTGEGRKKGEVECVEDKTLRQCSLMRGCSLSYHTYSLCCMTGQEMTVTSSGKCLCLCMDVCRCERGKRERGINNLTRWILPTTGRPGELSLYCTVIKQVTGVFAR